MPVSPLPTADLDHVLAHTREVWEAARGSRIFLTGGTGFFGPWLVETFAYANEALRLGAELVVLSRDPDAAVGRLPHYANLQGVTFHRGDVRDFTPPAGSFDTVIHGAAESSQQGHVGDHRLMFDTIVDGTRSTLGLARSAGVKRYLLLSSGAVYGRQPANLSHVPEDYTGAPDLGDARSGYGEGKRAAEVLAAIAASESGLSVRVARCFAFVGPHLPLDIHFAIGNFIRDALRGGPIRIRGDGTAVRSYLYMADLAIWLWTLALSSQASGAYNVGSAESVSIRETANRVAAVIDPGVRVEVEGKPTPGQAPQRYVPAIDRMRQQLLREPLIGLEDGIRRTAAWHNAGVDFTAPRGSNQ
jgi:dTDP-glucose 4,6-dehydratase